MLGMAAATSLGAAHPPRSGLTVRTVMVAGALIVGIWLSAWYYFSHQIARLEDESQTISGRYLLAQEELSSTRGDVYRASILIRDLLMSSGPPSAAVRREPLDAYESADARLAHYDPVQPGGDRTRIDQLRQEIQALRQATASLIATDDLRWAEAARTWRLSDMRPRREAAIGIANELQALNREAFLQHQRRLMAVYGDIQWRFSSSLAIALLASLGIAMFTTKRVTRLERRLFEQHEKDRENQHDLQRLSAALITAQEEERRSIARELHDEVGQVLTAIKVELSVVERGLKSAGQRGAVLDDARMITDRALQTVRDLSRLLHPAMLDDIGLTAALDWYVRGYSKRHGITVDYFASPLDRRLAADLEANLYRIVQETLTNIVKHADVRACALRITRVEGQVVVSISDEGRGFDMAEVRPSSDAGLGLIGIRERAALLGGVVSIESARGQGTHVEVRVPLRWRDDVGDTQSHHHDDPRSVPVGQSVFEG